MLFNSLHFTIFLPIVLFLHFLLPMKYRWILLLSASYYFYMSWKHEYLLLIVFSTLVDFFAAKKIHSSTSEFHRKLFLIVSIAVNLSVLFTFKYFNFFIDNLNVLVGSGRQFSYLHLLLPVGISFYTFQSMSYTVDVYFKKIQPERHLGYFATYISFFPQLVAGPIERAKSLLPQFRMERGLNRDNVADGLKLILWGFFKKLVVADRVAFFVNEVYGSPGEYFGFHVLIATLFFAYQIYCDFSGYTDIARGSALIFNFKLMENFNLPYYSSSISELWKRWHISLSSWFRDYVYIPLGGNRVSTFRLSLNLLVTFVVSGLWHGANWTYIVWGAIHGGLLIVERFLKGLIQFPGIIKDTLLSKLIPIGFTFLLVNISWVFFRANNVGEAFLLLENATNLQNQFWGVGVFGKSNLPELILSFGFIFLLEVMQYCSRKQGILNFINHKPLTIRMLIYFSLLNLIVYFGVFNNSEFIYFQF